MARRPGGVIDDDDEEFAATVMMSDVRVQLGDDELTPRVAPQREVEPIAELVEAERTEHLPRRPTPSEGSLVGTTRPIAAPAPTQTPALRAPRPSVAPIVLLAMGLAALAWVLALM